MNIILILAHDTGRHFGCYGASGVETPGVDTLAAEGVLFTDHYAAAPTGVPARGALLTGRWPQSCGLMGPRGVGGGWRLAGDARTLADVLRATGYHTVLFRQQVLADDWERLGFDEFRAQEIPVGGVKTHGEAMTAPRVAVAVSEFLAEKADSDHRHPFFAQVAFHEAHMPWRYGGARGCALDDVTLPGFLAESDPARVSIAGLNGAIAQLDRGVAIILEALKRTGLERRTLVVFTADHGPELPRARGQLYDPGLGVPLIIRRPGGKGPAGRRCDWLSSAVDLMPTILRLTGVHAPPEVQGRSFGRAVRSGRSWCRRDAVQAMAALGDARALRSDRYKFICNFGARPWIRPPVDMAAPAEHTCLAPPIELYDLKRDPNETINVAGQSAHAIVECAMGARLWLWLQSVADPVLEGPVEAPAHARVRAALKLLADNA